MEVRNCSGPSLSPCACEELTTVGMKFLLPYNNEEEEGGSGRKIIRGSYRAERHITLLRQSEIQDKVLRYKNPIDIYNVQGRAKKILLSSVTHVPSGLLGCALAA